VLKRTWVYEARNVPILVAFGVNEDGYREILGAAEGEKEDRSGWAAFIASLQQRRLEGVQLFISENCIGRIELLNEYFPEALWKRCMVHFYRYKFSNVPLTKVREVAAMLKTIHAQEDRPAPALCQYSCHKIFEKN